MPYINRKEIRRKKALAEANILSILKQYEKDTGEQLDNIGLYFIEPVVRSGRSAKDVLDRVALYTTTGDAR